MPRADLNRYTDFLVNEILPSGEVIHLDNLQAPRKNKEANNGSKPSGPSHPTAKVLQDVVPDADISAKEEAESNAKKEILDAPPQPSSPAVKLDDDSSPDSATDTLTNVDPSSMPTIPASMQDFDTPPKDSKNLAPHMRISPTSAPVPLSMRDMDVPEPTPKPARKKETVRIRRSSQGWVEVDEQKEKGTNHAEPVDDAAVKQGSEKASIQEPVMQEPTIKPPPPPPPSTQAAWQTFASKTSAETEAEIGFQASYSTESFLLRQHLTLSR